MSMISEQVNELREEADFILENSDKEFPATIGQAKIMKRAADTIEQLAAKLQALNKKSMFAYLDGVADSMKEDEKELEAYQKAFEDIRAEIEDGLNACIDIIDNTKKGVYPQIYSDDQMEGRKITYEHCIQIISKHDPSKAGKEQTE